MRFHLRPAALAVAAALAATPAAASASTWTVDDDKAQCPNAAFSKIQAAVDQAAPWDTVVVCDGTYREVSVPFNSAQTPAAVGSRNGLTITKPLTIKGAGAGKVTIMPDVALGATLAGTVPYLRDGGGNVVTVSRQSNGSSDDNENFVDISGVTITSPSAFAEAGVAFFNTGGRISNSVVGPFRRASGADPAGISPYGYGVVQSNSLQGTEAGVRRTVTVQDSVVTGYQTGGVLFDDARGPDGDPANLVRSGIVAYGNVLGSRIQGAGGSAVGPQTGIRYAAGHRGLVSGSEVLDHRQSTNAAGLRANVGLLLTDAGTGDDPSNPGVQAVRSTGNVFERNGTAIFNATADNSAVRTASPLPSVGDWFGCPAGPLTTPSSSDPCQPVSGNDPGGAASVTTTGYLTERPATLELPKAQPDAAPAATIADPVDGLVVPVGATIQPVVQAADDFGVKAVMFGATTKTTAPYEFSWTATAADAGRTVPLTATVTDSAGQTSTATVSVVVPAPKTEEPPPAEEPPPPAVTPPTPVAVPAALTPPTLGGSAMVGSRVTCTPGSWSGAPTSYAIQWLRDGAAIKGAISSSYAVTQGDLGSTLTCAVVAANAGGAGAAATSDGLSVKRADKSTEKSLVVQVGPGLVTLSRRVAASTRSTRIALGSFRCVRAGATCSVELTARVRIAGRTFTTKRTTSLTSGGSTPLSATLSTAARRALARAGGGTVGVTASASDGSGLKGSVKRALTLTKR
ncbi:hypothetical protein [Conexibacter sp. SYSU D00693]|uniref:hypothetical protein n=1 Tax=Conexibacter sp. SYSU D00693 TaxID=2812560 RepID=UPI00196A83EF|nr:hypothetical protein [Conexibacter sp. SYSU D00693]